MNRYPRWIYVTIAVALALGLLYTLPNFFGEAPAVQVSTARTTLKIDSTVLGRVEDALKKAGIQPTGVFLDINSVKVRFADTDTQLKAKDVINQVLNPDPQDPSYTVALNLLSNSPAWLAAIPIIPARPMYLGLDLRGGVHFLLQVDMRAALSKQLDSYVGDIRSQLRDKNVRHAGIARESNGIAIHPFTRLRWYLATQSPTTLWKLRTNTSWSFKGNESITPASRPICVASRVLASCSEYSLNDTAAISRPTRSEADLAGRE